MEIIEVNGVKYSKNEPKPVNKGVRKSIMAMLSAGMLFSGYPDGLGGGYSRKRPDVDIVEEYGLIQQKKSSLSRSDRDWVVRVFEQNYTKIKLYERL